MLVISPYSKQNDVDHTQVDQASILKFVEQNWQTGQIGDSSFDRTAGSITGMFNFSAPQNREVLLASDGAVAKVVPTRPVRPAD
jgi:phospholipase C